MNSGQSSAFEEGMRLLQAGDARAAANHLHQAVQQNPSDGRACGYLGIALIRVGEVATGVAWLQEAARLQPTDSSAQYNLAVALIQAQRFAEARAALQQALALDPNNAKARAALASLPADVTQAPAPVPAAPTTPPGGYGLNSWPAQQTAPSPAPTSSVSPAPSYPAAGMHYTPTATPRVTAIEPPMGLRIARGLGWGALYGQWWTLWNMFSFVLWGGLSSGGHIFGLGIVLMTIACVIFFAFVGTITGLIIGAANLMPRQGAIVGIVAGMFMLGGELLLIGNAMLIVNAFFWYVTGRYVGAHIAYRVQQRIPV